MIFNMNYTKTLYSDTLFKKYFEKIKLVFLTIDEEERREDVKVGAKIGV